MSHYSDFIRTLYQIVDNKDARALAELLHPDVMFTFSNAETVSGVNAVTAINAQFFASIQTMNHTFAGMYEVGDTLVCEGQVDYIRLDGSAYDAKFATILTLKDGLIYQYKIFADVSGL
ncbi:MULTISPECIES: nuclear transport factor 2 family protein [Vibrio]|uniref:nuclear transport factor 2 family protein n=1 Tax=Vibrio TaxID=662 RepID=UPI0001B95800|nr:MULTISPECIES: nuclear transport factor 2 family protein [Vibrio]EEX34312.1 hypothetical protein VIC_001108 [Vibrio coralliilyticus ATCC BAA-450]MDE3898355.1 nuclear transport factor 2 family protein [Vibrio sp. CC007]